MSESKDQNPSGELAKSGEDNSETRSISFASKVFQQIRWKRLAQVIMDFAVLLVALLAAYLIRFDGHIGSGYWYQLSVFGPIAITMLLLSNWMFGAYRRLWRYTGLTEVMELLCSVLSVTTILLVVRASGYLIIGGHHMSYGIIFINCGLAFLMLTAPRVLRRLATEHRNRKHWRQPIRRRSLVVGAGDAGQMVLKELSLRPDLGVDVVGLIDDDPSKFKTRIGSITVFGTTQELPNLIDSLFIDQVIIAMPSAPASEIRKIVEICRDQEVDTRILPGLFELIDGKVSVSQLREVSLEDLLGRAPIEMDNASIASYLEEGTVLVTGAGGSIGSELCRQIMRFQPKKLILLGKGENSIFTIEQELKSRPEPIEVVPVIADIRDVVRMRSIFEKYKPTAVFHAAAHKHVPLMEANITEAVSNNVFGTRVVAELSHLYEVGTFVLVSSDKAVNPTSVMGATKRMAELVVQDLATRTKTKYVAVRFGNVLASRGSVIPVWRQQIAQGGPVTVTHPEATRYFMLIPEAVQLILQATALGKGGEIFVLDMGEPVKILDLANDLIRFSGLKPGADIEIEFIGLRPGEKLYEELLTREEGLSKTVYDKIFVGKPQPINKDELSRTIETLQKGIEETDDKTVYGVLNKTVGGSLKTGDNLSKTYGLN